MKPRRLLIRAAATLATLAAIGLWLRCHRDGPEAGSKPPQERSPVRSTTAAAVPAPTAAMRLLDGYGDPSTPPLDDLRKLHRVASGYYSVVKDASRFPIGGNEDLAAALRGENPNRETFVPAGHPLFLDDGRIGDRWGNPMIVHPIGWKQLEFRSAGPDRKPFTEDDLVLDAKGNPAG